MSPTEIAPFRERAPWLGPDLQTVRNILKAQRPDLLGAERLMLRLPDGDRLAARLDRPHASVERPLVVLIHGLTGSEASVNVMGTAGHLVSEGWPVLRLNLRGSAPSRASSKGRYHAGRTEDLAAALRELPAAIMRWGVILLGHSLGGNLVLKFMGEDAHGLPVLGAVAVSTPLDLLATCRQMMAPRNVLYHRYMLESMKREAVAAGAALSAAERDAIAKARTVFEFDDQFVAPHFGYRDAPEYYEFNSSSRFVADILLPTLIVHAFDDPWIPASCYKTVEWRRLPAIETVFSAQGGHLGFHGRGSPIPWHDRVVAAWIRQRFAASPSP